MRKIFGFLALAPVSGFIAAAILIACVWFLSDLLPFLADGVLWIVIGVIVFLYLLHRRATGFAVEIRDGNA